MYFDFDVVSTMFSRQHYKQSNQIVDTRQRPASTTMASSRTSGIEHNQYEIGKSIRGGDLRICHPSRYALKLYTFTSQVNDP